MIKKALAGVGVLVLCLFCYVCGWESHSAYMRQQLAATLQNASGAIRPPLAGGAAPASGSAQPAPSAIRIEDISTRVTEANDGDEPASFTGLIQFVDKDGYIVDEDRQYDMVLAPQDEQIFSGFKLIRASVAGNVKSVSAKIETR